MLSLDPSPTRRPDLDSLAEQRNCSAIRSPAPARSQPSTVRLKVGKVSVKAA